MKHKIPLRKGGKGVVILIIEKKHDPLYSPLLRGIT